MFILYLMLIILVQLTMSSTRKISGYNEECGNHLGKYCDDSLELLCRQEKCVCQRNKAFDEVCGYHDRNYSKVCWKQCVGAAGQGCAPKMAPSYARSMEPGLCIRNSRCLVAEDPSRVYGPRKEVFKNKMCVCDPGYTISNRRCVPTSAKSKAPVRLHDRRSSSEGFGGAVGAFQTIFIPFIVIILF